MKLEVGKSYKTRDGEVVTIISSNGGVAYPFLGRFKQGCIFHYTPEGRFYAGDSPDIADLVEEVTEFEQVNTTSPAKKQAGGLKFDGGKLRWSLLLSPRGMLAAIKGVLNVLEFGAKKYDAHSWRNVEDNKRRYMDAMMRHLSEVMEKGLDARDEETGLLHMDHVNCNGLFLAELAREESNGKSNSA